MLSAPLCDTECEEHKICSLPSRNECILLTRPLSLPPFLTKIFFFPRLRISGRLFEITNLMHNSFIIQQYVRYTTILNMFRAARCSSSGGQIVLLQPLVSSPSVSSRTVCRLRADCSPLSTGILYGCLQRVTIPEAVVIQFVLLRMSSVLLETC